MSLASDMLFTQAECQATLLSSAEGNLCNVINETALLGQCVQEQQPLLRLKESS